MPAPSTAAPASLSYPQARALALAGGVVIVGLLAGVMWARRVETVEIVAVLMFLPVFGAVVVWDVAGGAVAGALGAAVYVGLRWSAIQAVGLAAFGGLIASRVVGLIAFGVIGGLANRQLRTSLTKLDLYDQIDDATGLYNARFMIAEIDLETARSARYETIFAVSVVDIPPAWLLPLGRRQRSRLLRELGRVVTKSIRTVDRGTYCSMPDAHRVAVMLPETGPEGARIFTDRLVPSLGEWLASRGVTGPGNLRPAVITYPGGDADLEQLKSELEIADRISHPRTSRPATA